MAMPFPDNSFDSVLDTFGLEYVLNPHKALK
jgi:ubiquinone/menaquinone biosynthesis C-methylase UbiE